MVFLFIYLVIVSIIFLTSKYFEEYLILHQFFLISLIVLNVLTFIYRKDKFYFVFLASLVYLLIMRFLKIASEEYFHTVPMPLAKFVIQNYSTLHLIYNIFPLIFIISLFLPIRINISVKKLNKILAFSLLFQYIINPLFFGSNWLVLSYHETLLPFIIFTILIIHIYAYRKMTSYSCLLLLFLLLLTYVTGKLLRLCHTEPPFDIPYELYGDITYYEKIWFYLHIITSAIGLLLLAYHLKEFKFRKIK